MKKKYTVILNAYSSASYVVEAENEEEAAENAQKIASASDCEFTDWGEVEVEEVEEREEQPAGVTSKPKCSLCGGVMPQGEEAFKYHGYSGPCPTSVPLFDAVGAEE